MEKHESVEARTKNNADAPQQRKNVVWLIFFFQSVVAAALFPVVLGRSGGDTRIAVWRLSLLLCSYFYSAVCVLRARTRKALLFVFLAYTALLAFVVDAVLSHAAGAVILYLDSVWMACLFGKALAEHSASGKSAAATAAAENPAPAQEEEEKLARELKLIMSVVIVLSARAIVTMCVYVPDCSLVSVVVLSTILCICLPVAIICALNPSRQGGCRTVASLGWNVVPENSWSALCWYLLSFMLFILFFLLVSKVGGVVSMWICVLVLAVFLGYGLRLHDYYVHNMRSKPEMVARPDDQIMKKQADDEINKKQAAGGSKELPETNINTTKC